MHHSRILCFVATHSLFSSTVSADLDRSRTQFKQWFPTVQQWDAPRFHNTCKAEFTNYFNESLPDPGRGHKYSSELINCILNDYGELNKANMAVTAILLALLPAGLVQFGPGMGEISFLSTRRPVLALLLGFGLMSPNPTEFDYHEILKKAEHGGDALIPLRENGNLMAKILISLIEYVIAAGATGNYFYQIYRFTYQAISIAPLVVYLPGLPETATLFGWGFLTLPIYLLSFIVCALAVHQATGQRGKRNRWAQFIVDELCPCGQGREMTIIFLENRKFLRHFLESAVRLVAVLHIILGTVLIGSVVLVPLADSLPVIYTFVFAALLTRVVLSFELNCLARKTICLESSRPHSQTTEPRDVIGHDRQVAGQKGYEGLRQSE